MYLVAYLFGYFSAAVKDFELISTRYYSLLKTQHIEIIILLRSS